MRGTTLRRGVDRATARSFDTRPTERQTGADRPARAMVAKARVRRRDLLGSFLVAGVLMACGSGDGTGGSGTPGDAAETSDASSTPDTTTSPSDTTAGTAGSGTTAVANEPAESTCGLDEQPVVTAFELESGTVRWESCPAEAGSWWPVGASEELVYFTVTPPSSGGASAVGGPSLVALDTQTGSERWRTDLGPGFLRVPSGRFPGDEVAVVVVAVDGDNSDIVGLDPATGQTLWTASGTNGGYATDADVVVGGWSTTEAFDRATGEPRWSVAQQGGYGNPVIADDLVVISTDSGAVALDLETGGEEWRTARQLPGVPGGVVDGILVWGGQDDPVSGVDLATGEVLWTQPGHTTYDDVFAIGDGAVYVFGVDEDGSGESTATAYEVATGEARWRQSLGQQFGPWPYVANDDVVVAVDPNVLVLSTDDGSERWSTPAVGATVRYVGAAMNSDAVFVTAEPSAVTADSSALDEPTTEPEVTVSSVRCAGGERLGAGFGPVGTSGGMAEVVASADRTAFCVVTPDGTEDVIEVQPDRQVAQPEATTIAGTLAVYVQLTVPPTWSSAPLEITDESGERVLAVPMPDRDDILVIDVFPTPDAPAESYAQREWTVSRDGDEIGTITVSLPA